MLFEFVSFLLLYYLHNILAFPPPNTQNEILILPFSESFSGLYSSDLPDI